MGKLTFILGGARSGKSSYALKIAKGKVAFIATCKPKDPEMKRRIALHKKSRPAHWATFECPDDLPGLLREINSKFELVIIDCLTLFVADLLLKKNNEITIQGKINAILDVLKKCTFESIIVSNEVGLGIVPTTALGREFRDIAGRVNQVVAAKAGEVFFLVSGIPWRIK